MGRPYQEKFAGVHWETNEEHLQAWKDGKTGVPIVDAAMRQGKKMGWMQLLVPSEVVWGTWDERWGNGDECGESGCIRCGTGDHMDYG